MDQLSYRWLDHPVDVDPELRVPGYRLIDNILHDCSQNYTAGAFPCLEVRFHLKPKGILSSIYEAVIGN